MDAQGSTASVAVIGAPLDIGAGRRGVDMGPSAIRYAGLDARIVELGRRCVDWGDVVTAVAEASAVGDERVRFLPEIKETCERIADLVARAVRRASSRSCWEATTRSRSGPWAGSRVRRGRAECYGSMRTAT